MKNKEDQEWLGKLGPDERFFAERLLERKLELANALEASQKERDRCRDEKRNAKAVVVGVAAIALTFILAGAYLVITTDESDHQVQNCAGMTLLPPGITNGTLSLDGTSCGIESDKGATILLGFWLFGSGMLMTVANILRALWRI